MRSTTSPPTKPAPLPAPSAALHSISITRRPGTENQPESHGDDRAVHGAACHSWLLILDTSCEYRNLILDRALVVEALSSSGEAFFGALADAAA